MIQQHGTCMWHVGKHKVKGDTKGKMKGVLVHGSVHERWINHLESETESGDSNMVHACGM